jgi:hypothetical protein
MLVLVRRGSTNPLQINWEVSTCILQETVDATRGVCISDNTLLLFPAGWLVGSTSGLSQPSDVSLLEEIQ